MKLQPECIPCFLNQTLRALRLWNLSREIELKTLREVMRALTNENYEKTPFQIACIIFRKLRESSSIEDPYSEIKRKQNEAALRMYSKLKEEVYFSRDPFLEALKLSVAGNIIDFGSPEGYKITPEKAIEIARKISFKKDCSEDLRRELREARKIAFFADNCGEIVFDKLFLEVISAEFNLKEITIYVRGGPILNDVTPKEAMEVGLYEMENVEVRTVSNGDPGTGPEISSEKILEEIKTKDVIISKGQANYEALGDLSGIYFLLIAKCGPVARDLKVNVGDPVVWKRPRDYI